MKRSGKSVNKNKHSYIVNETLLSGELHHINFNIFSYFIENQYLVFI